MPTKTSKKDHSFYNIASLKKPHSFNEPRLESLNIVKNILPQHAQKPYSLYKFSRKHVSGWCQKKTDTAPFLDTQELHS